MGMQTGGGGGGAGTQTGAPQTGRGARRRRNSLQNAQSKITMPGLAPSQGFGYAAQIAGLQSTYSQTLAAIQANAAAARGQFISTKGDIKAQQIADTAGVANAAADRGLTNSSIDLGGRAGAAVAAGNARGDALAARNQALLQLKLQKMQAGTDLYTGVAQVQGEKAAAQQEAAIAKYQAGMYDEMQQNYQQLYQDILQRLLAKKPALRRKYGKAIAGIPDPFQYPGVDMDASTPTGKPFI